MAKWVEHQRAQAGNIHLTIGNNRIIYADIDDFAHKTAGRGILIFDAAFQTNGQFIDDGRIDVLAFGQCETDFCQFILNSFT